MRGGSVHVLMNVLEVRQPHVHRHNQSQAQTRMLAGHVLFNNFTMVLVPFCYILAWFRSSQKYQYPYLCRCLRNVLFLTWEFVHLRI